MNKISRTFRGLVGLSVLVGAFAVILITGWATTTYLPQLYGDDIGGGWWTYTKNGSLFLIVIAVSIFMICFFAYIIWGGLREIWELLVAAGGDILGYKEPVIETPETELTEVVEH